MRESSATQDLCVRPCPIDDVEGAPEGLASPPVDEEFRRLRSRIVSLESELLASQHAIERMRLGMILLDALGNILKLNREARAILDERDGLLVNGGRLVAHDRTEARDFTRLVNKALREQVGGRVGPIDAMSVTRRCRPGKLSVMVSALAPSGTFERGRPTVVLFIREPARSVDVSHDSVMRLFQLTPRQALLACLLMKGLTLNEAAARIGVKRNTVRSHLREVYARIGVRHRANLVHTLLNSAAMLL